MLQNPCQPAGRQAGRQAGTCTGINTDVPVTAKASHWPLFPGCHGSHRHTATVPESGAAALQPPERKTPGWDPGLCLPHLWTQSVGEKKHHQQSTPSPKAQTNLKQLSPFFGGIKRKEIQQAATVTAKKKLSWIIQVSQYFRIPLLTSDKFQYTQGFALIGNFWYFNSYDQHIQEKKSKIGEIHQQLSCSASSQKCSTV